ncbi:MAG TPA: alpha/beta hydrolase [Stellaceae bacterium]|jgi:pimeloyl-ACP methyl ester carboxylesterase|nr:alpha/beta hydrolase [Stellaceae bacterium]
MVANFHSRFLMVDGLRTHYLEAGSGPTVVLLHSGEFGACAELSWEFNIEALARHFHVLAPDWLGFGQSAKVFSFEDMWLMRARHTRHFLDALCIGKAHFIGNSMAGGVLLTIAAMAEPLFPIDRMIVVSGGGYAPENEFRKTLNTYDGTREHMKRIVEAMFINPKIRADEAYIDRRFRLSQEPGAWQCTAAARFKSPWGGGKAQRRPDDYGAIKVPTLIVAGAQDTLREPGYPQALQKDVPGSELVVFPEAGHCAQIDEPEAFNRVAIEFLGRGRS